MIVIEVKDGKKHIRRKDEDKSLCGQAPWSKPVDEFEGIIEDVTCQRCMAAIRKAGA